MAWYDKFNPSNLSDEAWDTLKTVGKLAVFVGVVAGASYYINKKSD